MSQVGTYTPSPTLPSEAVLLTANLGKLSAKDQEFASSLLEAARSPRGCSPKQAHWLSVLAERATQEKVVATQVTADLTKLNEMFATAKASGIKSPYILADGPEDLHGLRLKLAGPTSRNAGQVYVYTNHKAYEDRAWLGRIDEAGAFHPSRECVGPLVGEVSGFLSAIAADPEGTSKAYGRKFGACCFCSRELTTKASIFAGYGPICADKFGLAWGTCEEVA